MSEVVEIEMSNGTQATEVARERLSALVDGELDSQWVGEACALWRNDAELRSTWHAYQLIGDALRSEDLTQGAARDESFLMALRARMADEPTILAPEPVVPVQVPLVPGVPQIRVAGGQAADGGRQARWSWWAPTAVAAGFVAVAGAVLVTRGPVPRGPETTLAASPAALQPIAQAETAVVNGNLIRDARLDRYLSAHKQFAGSSALGVPSAFLRDASAEASGR